VTNDPVTALERAVADLVRFAGEQPGEIEADLPRIRAAEFALLNVRSGVANACQQARRDALHRATQRRIAQHLEHINVHA